MELYHVFTIEYWLGQFVNDVSLRSTRDEKLSRKVINLGWSAYFIVIIHVTGIYPFFENFENFVDFTGIYPRIYGREPL